MVKETLFFSSPSTSGLAAAYQVIILLSEFLTGSVLINGQEGDIIALYTELRDLVSSHKSKAIDTSQMHSVPVDQESSN